MALPKIADAVGDRVVVLVDSDSKRGMTCLRVSHWGEGSRLCQFHCAGIERGRVGRGGTAHGVHRHRVEKDDGDSRMPEPGIDKQASLVVSPKIKAWW